MHPDYKTPETFISLHSEFSKDKLRPPGRPDPEPEPEPSTVFFFEISNKMGTS